MTPEQFARMVNPAAQKNYDDGKSDTIKAVLEIIDRCKRIYDGEKEETVIATLDFVRGQVLALKGGE